MQLIQTQNFQKRVLSLSPFGDWDLFIFLVPWARTPPLWNLQTIILRRNHAPMPTDIRVTICDADVCTCVCACTLWFCSCYKMSWETCRSSLSPTRASYRTVCRPCSLLCQRFSRRAVAGQLRWMVGVYEHARHGGRYLHHVLSFWRVAGQILAGEDPEEGTAQHLSCKSHAHGCGHWSVIVTYKLWPAYMSDRNSGVTFECTVELGRCWILTGIPRAAMGKYY